MQHTTGTFGKLVDLRKALSVSLPNKMLKAAPVW